MKLNAKNVNEVFTKCLFKDGENTDNKVIAEGIMNNFGFNPERLEENKQNILDMLSGLPDPFRKSIGGGWSFLQACVDRNDIHWAEHSTIEQLLALGIATKQASILVPREMWAMFPGGMPYFQVEI